MFSEGRTRAVAFVDRRFGGCSDGSRAPSQLGTIPSMGLKRFIVAILRWFNSEPRATTGGTYVRDAVEQNRAQAALRIPDTFTRMPGDHR